MMYIDFSKFVSDIPCFLTYLAYISLVHFGHNLGSLLVLIIVIEP
jgi:hypothetical protein